MGNMFYCCSKLSSPDLSGWDTSNVTYMGGMFSDCPLLDSLDLSGWDISNVTGMDSMFYDCSSLVGLITGGGWSYSPSLERKPTIPRVMYDESGVEFARNSTIPDGAHVYTATKPGALAAQAVAL